MNGMDRVIVSVPEIFDRMGRLSMNMTMLSKLAGSDMWSVTRTGRTTKLTAYEIASALKCKPSDIIVGVPEETQVLTSVVYGPECHEVEPCFGRSEDGHCRILARGYDRGHRCPFRKEKRGERGA